MDTQEKRLSIMSILVPAFIATPWPGGGIDIPDCLDSMWVYRGLAAAGSGTIQKIAMTANVPSIQSSVGKPTIAIMAYAPSINTSVTRGG